jgi:hypothetical protein
MKKTGNNGTLKNNLRQSSQNPFPIAEVCIATHLL